jgi:hypothetical protein
MLLNLRKGFRDAVFLLMDRLMWRPIMNWCGGWRMAELCRPSQKRLRAG